MKLNGDRRLKLTELYLKGDFERIMPSCCAVGCTNSGPKGFLMKRFPRDPERRKAWAMKVNRENWTPKDSSYLCEIHFTPDMFEQNRADGRKLLKHNAIPSIFLQTSLKNARKHPMKTLSVNTIVFDSIETPEQILELVYAKPSRKRENSESTSSYPPLLTLQPQKKYSDLKQHGGSRQSFINRSLLKKKAAVSPVVLDFIEIPEEVVDVGNAGTSGICEKLESTSSGPSLMKLLPQTKYSDLKVQIVQKRTLKPVLISLLPKKESSVKTVVLDFVEIPEQEQVLDVGNSGTSRISKNLESTSSDSPLLTPLPQTKCSDLKVQILHNSARKSLLRRLLPKKESSVNNVVLDFIETPEQGQVVDVGNAKTFEMLSENSESTSSGPPLLNFLPQTKCSDLKGQIVHKRALKPPLRRLLPKKELSIDTVFLDSIQTPEQEQVLDVSNDGTSRIREKLESTSSDPPSLTLLPRTNCSDLELQIANYSRALKKMSLKNKILKNKLRQAKRKIKTLCEADVHLKSLRKLFSDDQVKFLIKGHNNNWSKTSIINAMKIKLSCGKSGYNELLKLNFPLPSLRTLRRRILSIKKTNA